MLKLISKSLISLMALYAVSAHAGGFSLDGTRFIYDSQQKSITVQVTNESSDLQGGQVWIGNGDHDKNKVFFIPTPSFFTIGSNQVQVIRLMNIDPSLPTNKESLFWLNVQSIPQQMSGSGLQFAVDTKVKLIYRPHNLEADRPNAELKIKLEDVNGKLVLKNPTPYFFAIISESNNGKALKLTKKESNELSIFKPFSSVSLNVPYSSIGKFGFQAINDYGGIVTYTLNK